MKDVKSQNEFRDNLPVSIFRCSILDRAQAYMELSTLVWFFRHKSPSLRWGILPVFVYIRFHKSPNTAKQVESLVKFSKGGTYFGGGCATPS